MKRGRKSAASMAVVSSIIDARPAPPEELTDLQQGEWRAIVRRMPHDWFPRETHGVLAAYCRHFATHSLLSAEIDTFEAKWIRDTEGVKYFGTLTALRDRESKAMLAAARSLRISKSSQLRPETAARSAAHGGTIGRKPWDFEAEGGPESSEDAAG